MRALYSVQLINYSAPTHQFSIVFNSETASRYPDNSITNVVQNGDPVSVTLTSLNGTTQYWLKKVDGSHVQVYQDQGLTSLVPDTTASGWNGWFATYAMTCPAQNSVSLPQPMYADTTAWVNGAPKVRCVQIQANDACSDFPASGEAAAYPCARPGTAGSKSMLHEWTTSDGIGDLAFTGTNGPDGEGMYVLTSSCSNGLCTITAVRDYEDDATVANYGFTHSISASYHANQHAPGWTMRAESAVEFGWVNGSVFPPTYYSPPNLSGHMDLVAGVTPGNITTGVGPGPNQRDSCTNCTLQELSSDVKSTTNSLPVWQAPGYTFGGPMSYPSTRVWPPVAPATEVIAKDGVNVQRWRTDWLQWNTSIGGFSVLGTTALTLQTGTSHVYKVTPANAPLNVKIAPIYASDGVGRVYKDISSAATGNVITDATADSFCLALVAGQCRSGSSAGDIYLSTVGINYDGNCRVNNNNLPTPCVMGLPPWVNRAIQESQYPVDTNASRYRLLVMGFQQPLTGYAYSNWVPTPDGRWGIWAQNPPARHTFPGNGESDYWAMKLPPWPDEDHVNRSRYVPVEWRLSGSPGDRIRIAFGYAENGDPAKLYCTSRQETCWTSSAATDTNPFVFDSEAQQKTACDQGCVVNIPAIPGRVLFFQIERSNGSNAQLGPLQTRAVR
jgi:hypothetical protein